MDHESQLTGLLKFDAAKQAIETASSIDEVKDIRNKAEAFRAYAKQAHLSLGMQNKCAEIKVRAERRAGELLGEMEKNPGGDPRPNNIMLLGPPKLSEIGISKIQSSRWQQMASIPESVFEDHIAETIGTEEELTSSSLLHIAQVLKIKQKRKREKGKYLNQKHYHQKNLVSIALIA